MKKNKKFDPLSAEEHRLLAEENDKKLRHQRLVYVLLTIATISWLSFAFFYHKTYQSISELESRSWNKVSSYSKIKTAQASNQAPDEMSMKEWIKWRVGQTNINWKDFDCMVRHESNYNQYAINKNTNGTFDTGYLQINDIHRLPRELTFDYKQATEWAIKKINRDGGMNAWFGYTNFCK